MGSDAGPTGSATGRVGEALRLRAARDEANGVLRGWGGPGADRGRRDHESAAADRDAARVRAEVDERASCAEDPDFEM